MPSTKPKCAVKVRDGYGRRRRCDRVVVADERCAQHQGQPV
jgi:hypothetical protein